MRAGVAGVVILVILQAVAAAQPSDGGLRAAVAPAQTVVDAAARAVHLAVEEADRDGSPDEARDLIAAVTRFTLDLRVEWSMPESAMFGREATRALDYAVRVGLALEDLPEAAQTTATTRARCDALTATSDETLVALVGAATLESVASALDGLASEAPEGVDARELAVAAQRLGSWAKDLDVETRCPPPAGPFLLLTASPNMTHAGGSVRIAGATNAADTVNLSLGSLGLSLRTDVSRLRFVTHVTIPSDAPRGVASLVATAGVMRNATNITIAGADATILVQGPRAVVVGSSATYRVFLVSPLADEVQNATVRVGEGGTLQLVGGAAEFSFTAASSPGQQDVPLAFAGTARVSPTSTTLRVDVVPQPVASERVVIVGEADEALTPWMGAGAAAVVLGIGWLAWRRRRRQAPRPQSPQPVVAAPTPTGPVAPGLVGMFVALVRWLRASERITPGATPREVGSKLAAWRVPAPAAVSAFERARYGGIPVEASIGARLREQLAQRWERLREMWR